MHSFRLVKIYHLCNQVLSIYAYIYMNGEYITLKYGYCCSDWSKQKRVEHHFLKLIPAAL